MLGHLLDYELLFRWAVCHITASWSLLVLHLLICCCGRRTYRRAGRSPWVGLLLLAGLALWPGGP